jgi:hypothetical protein
MRPAILVTGIPALFLATGTARAGEEDFTCGKHLYVYSDLSRTPWPP